MTDRKKILHVSNWLGMGGAEKLLVETLPLYHKAGFDVELLLMTDIDTPLRNELEKNIKVHTLPYSSFYNIRSVFLIMPFIQKYDLVHVHLFPSQYYVALAKLLSRSKTPLIFTEHSTSNRRLLNDIFILPEKLIYSQYKRVICITEQVKETLERRYKFSNRQLLVIENGVDLERIYAAKAYEKKDIRSGLNESDILILQVSSFQEPKDQRTVIKSLLHLPNQIKLLLVGDGVLKNDCERLVAELNLQDRVIFLGLRRDIPQLLKSVEFVVLSSKYEGLSLSSIEGMASGRPFIASDVPGLAEVVGGAGVLFPKGNEIKFAEEIIKLFENSEYYKEVTDLCIERAKKFDISKMVNRHIQLYNQIINS